MNASLAKATRRELRRAVGPQAIDTINAQAAKIEQLHQVITVARAEIVSLSKQIITMRDDVKVWKAQTERAWPHHETRIGRLRGLWSGR